MLESVINYEKFIIACIAIILLPGPNSMYVLSISRYGIKQGYKGALGIFVGDTILMLLTILGAGVVLKTNIIIFNLIKYLGAGYLFYLGLLIIKSSFKKQINKIPANINKRENFFIKALSISLINPKAILFFLAFFIQYINPSYSIWKGFLVLGITLQFISLLYLSLIIFLGKNLSNYFNKNIWLQKIGNFAIGSLFLYFAIKLLTSSI